MTCAICVRADETGWDGPGITHCGDCHFTWPEGVELCHCVECHRSFSSERAFTIHQVGDECECRDPSAITSRDGRPRLEPYQREYGEVWGEPRMGDEARLLLIARQKNGVSRGSDEIAA